MNYSLLISLLLFVSFSGYTQKHFLGFGNAAFTDWAVATAEAEPSEYTGIVQSTYGFSFYTASGQFKYNVYEFNSELALSIGASPAFGFFIWNGDELASTEGFGVLRVPLFVQLDIGNLSTFESTRSSGFGIGAGYQYENYLGLMSGGGAFTRIAYRYFNRNNKAKEISLKNWLSTPNES